MNSQQEKHDKILKHLRLHKEMSILPRSESFIGYVTEEYKNSKRKETDEAYNMYEINLLHRPSGTRLTLTKREDYMGDVIYKVVRIFIITTSKEELDILDADFENNIFFTTESKIPFSDTNAEI